MPAAAVIPAPIAYTNVVAVKKLVVGFHAEKYIWPFGLQRNHLCILLLLLRSLTLLCEAYVRHLLL